MDYQDHPFWFIWLINLLTARRTEFYFWELRKNNVAQNYSSVSLFPWDQQLIVGGKQVGVTGGIFFSSQDGTLPFGHFSLHVLIYFFFLFIQPGKQEMKLSVFKELIFVLFLLTVVVPCSFAHNLPPTIEQTISLLHAPCCSKLNIDQMW